MGNKRGYSGHCGLQSLFTTKAREVSCAAAAALALLLREIRHSVHLAGENKYAAEVQHFDLRLRPA